MINNCLGYKIEPNLGPFHVFLVDFDDNMFGPPKRLVSELIYAGFRDKYCSVSRAAAAAV